MFSSQPLRVSGGMQRGISPSPMRPLLALSLGSTGLSCAPCRMPMLQESVQETDNDGPRLSKAQACCHRTEFDKVRQPGVWQCRCGCHAIWPFTAQCLAMCSSPSAGDSYNLLNVRNFPCCTVNFAQGWAKFVDAGSVLQLDLCPSRVEQKP